MFKLCLNVLSTMWEKGEKREREWKMEKRGKWGEGAEKGLEKRGGEG